MEDDDSSEVVDIADDDIGGNSDALASVFPPDPLGVDTGDVVDDELVDKDDNDDDDDRSPLVLDNTCFNSLSLFSEDDEHLALSSNFLVAEDDSLEASPKGIGCSVILVAVDEGCGSPISLMKLMVVLLAVGCMLRLLARGGAGNTIPMG